jgi:rubredoxin
VSGHFFSGSFGGDDQKIATDTRLECKICWWVYDPKEGDPSRQIDPGTAFADLPWDWSCPNCSGNKQDFMVLDLE